MNIQTGGTYTRRECAHEGTYTWRRHTLRGHARSRVIHTEAQTHGGTYKDGSCTWNEGSYIRIHTERDTQRGMYTRRGHKQGETYVTRNSWIVSIHESLGILVNPCYTWMWGKIHEWDGPIAWQEGGPGTTERDENNRQVDKSKWRCSWAIFCVRVKK